MVIYEPKGRAREYAARALNIYKGCGHGCTYCFAPSATRKTREEFNRPEPRKDIVNKVRADCRKQLGILPRILLCFTCDPYQPIDEEHQLTRQVLEVLKQYGHSVQILTKGGLRAERDYDLLSPHDAVAATMTFLDDADSLKWEPGAALPADRMEGLKRAHEKGIETWVSLEPVIDPEQSIDIISATHEYVDLYKIGVLNYQQNEIDWKAFGERAVEMLEFLGKPYYLKKDLRKHLEIDEYENAPTEEETVDTLF